MDVIVNSNVQSPLVRTLARTKGKSESFTNHLKDNIPPVSFSKITLNPEGGATQLWSTGRSYKFKIPQYGYLRNFVLKFTSQDLPIPPGLMEQLYFDMAGIYSSGGAVTPAMTGSRAVAYLAATRTSPENTYGSLSTSTPLPVDITARAPNSMTYMMHGFVPYEEGNSVQNPISDPWAQMWLRVHGGYPLSTTAGTGSGNAALGAARMCPFRYDVRDNLLDSRAIGVGGLNGVESLFREGPSYDPMATGQTSGQDAMIPVNGSNRSGFRRWQYGVRSFNTWDWCTQSNLSKMLGCLIPQQVTLSTHNRQIQTIYPLETLTRIHRMPHDLKVKYLGMIRPHLVASPMQGNSLAFGDPTGPQYTANTGTAPASVEPTFVTNNASAWTPSSTIAQTIQPGTNATPTWKATTTPVTRAQCNQTNRQWSCYFPCFFSFFEDTSLNLDTRFVEALEIDVLVRGETNIFFPGDLGDLSTPAPSYSTPATYFTNNENNISYTNVNTGTNVQTTTRQYTQGNSDLSPFNSMRYRRMARVVDYNVTVQALAYFYNFHDTTSQAIRDANYKPNVPANLLTYNTYAENAVPITRNQLLSGAPITVNLSCNNLVFGLTFMIRRCQFLSDKAMEQAAFQDFTQTVPISQVTLTGSGQQLYQATGAECLMIDQWDNALSSSRMGVCTSNSSGLYADNMASSHVANKPTSDHFFGYYIPMGFSQDMTYNSGAIAMQTINNPTLTVQLLPLDGWVIQDTSLAVKNATFFNRNTFLGADTADDPLLLNDNEFELVIYENYWQMTRIDSNTGAITKSLDL